MFFSHTRPVGAPMRSRVGCAHGAILKANQLKVK